MDFISHHQRTVSFFKLLLIIGIVVILFFTYFFLTSLQTVEVYKDTNSKEVVKKNNYEITIFNTIFEGVNKDRQPYSILADTAIKIGEHIYDLEKVVAKYHLFDDSLNISSQHANIDDNNKFVTLQDEVKIRMSDLELSSQKIYIDLIYKKIFSDEKVVINYNSLRLEADNLSANANNNVIVLQGNVMAKININDF